MYQTGSHNDVQVLHTIATVPGRHCGDVVQYLCSFIMVLGLRFGHLFGGFRHPFWTWVPTYVLLEIQCMYVQIFTIVQCVILTSISAYVLNNKTCYARFVTTYVRYEYLGIFTRAHVDLLSPRGRIQVGTSPADIDIM